MGKQGGPWEVAATVIQTFPLRHLKDQPLIASQTDRSAKSDHSWVKGRMKENRAVKSYKANGQSPVNGLGMSLGMETVAPVWVPLLDEVPLEPRDRFDEKPCQSPPQKGSWVNKRLDRTSIHPLSAGETQNLCAIARVLQTARCPFDSTKEIQKGFQKDEPEQNRIWRVTKHLGFTKAKCDHLVANGRH